MFEPERYELTAGPAYQFDLDRREFLQTLGAGIVVALVLPAPADAQRGRGPGERLPDTIGAWLHIAEDGAVTVSTGKVEVGQDIRTSLTQVVAEELRVPMSSIRLILADTDLTPYDGGTTGSRTTPVMSAQLRKVAAAARELRDSGAMVKGQKITKTIGEPALTPPEQWKIAGRPAMKVNGREIVTGRHRYTPDVKRPGMLYGRVVRPAAFGATLASVDASAAEKTAGVTVVRDGNFLGVAAPDAATADQAAAAIRAEWKSSPQPSAVELFDYLKKNPSEARGGFGGASAFNRGAIEQGLAAADKKLQATYTVAYIAHAPLEPRAAVAEWSDGRLTVWTGTQRPFGVRSELAQAFGIPEDRIRVIVPDTGSGYGGKHSGEAATEAARLAKAVGKPVKLVWTREEEFTWAYFRPAGVIEVSSGVRSDGTITAWDFHNYNSGASGIRTLYDIPNQRIEFHAVRSPLRQGSYRALAATANHFARESHMDELAAAIGLEPLEFRFKNLKEPRLRAVLAAAAERFGWGREKASAERGFGIAGGFEKGAYVASCVEVAIVKGAVRVTRVVSAFECGTIINPDALKNQIEGAIIMGIGGALFEAIDFANGRVLNPRFSKYRVPRFSDAPALETVLLDRKDLASSGAGETPIVALAPAVGSAIFSATGTRLRSLPMAPQGLKG